MSNQHPLFITYTREWLHQVTGYSKSSLSRVATGKVPLSRSFIERACYTLGLPEEELFLPSDPVGIEQGIVGQWLRERCKNEHLTARQAAARTGLSHATISDIIKGSRPLPETIRKLAQGFSGNGHQRLALEDYLLSLAGYRTPLQGEKLSEPLAQLMGKVRGFSEPQIKMMGHLADFLAEMGVEREEGQ